jgi:DNA topoisomerase-1
VKYGSKYVSLKDDDPYTVTLERALECIRLKQEADANRIIREFGVDNIQVLNGRYGPYVTDGKKNAKIPKDRDPKSLELEECRAMLAAAPERGTGRFGRGKRAPAKTAKPEAAAADGAAKPAAKAKKTAKKPASGAPAAATEPTPNLRAAAKAARVPTSRAPARTRAPDMQVARVVKKKKSARAVAKKKASPAKGKSARG